MAISDPSLPPQITLVYTKFLKFVWAVDFEQLRSLLRVYVVNEQALTVAMHVLVSFLYSFFIIVSRTT